MIGFFLAAATMLVVAFAIHFFVRLTSDTTIQDAHRDADPSDPINRNPRGGAA